MKVACGDMEIIASLPPSSGVAMVMFSVVCLSVHWKCRGGVGGVWCYHIMSRPHVEDSLDIFKLLQNGPHCTGTHRTCINLFLMNHLWSASG